MAKKPKEQILADLQSDLTDIYARIGAAVCAWSQIEDELCRIFAIAVKSDSNLYPAEVYHAVISPEARLSMVDAVVRRRLAKEHDLLEKWDRIQKHINKKSKKRNEIAHCQVVTHADAKTGITTPYAIPYWASTKVAIRLTAGKRTMNQILGMDLGHTPLTISNIDDRILSFRQMYERVSEFRLEFFRLAKKLRKSPE